MTRKKFWAIIMLLIIVLFSEAIYEVNIKIQDYSLISKKVENIKEENLIVKENELVNAYGYDDYLDYNIEYSKVLYKDIYNIKNEITIYKGKKNGIQKNNLVIDKNGLVGIVSKVNKNSSIVRLLNNKNTMLSVKIDSSYGILKVVNNELIIEGINNKNNVKVGDKVTTSDISIYPEDILIGYVKEIELDNYEIEQIVKVKPATEINSIKYVGVITDLRG